MSNKEFDLIVFGATSFVGKILCNYLVNEHREPNLSWAMAGRSEAKLRTLKQSLGEAASRLPLIVADSSEESALRALCERTAVVISTVGPYALYGELLIKACASAGTDYCDLTGEPQWIRRMIERYHTYAEARGARIVNCCGFDSIPSDLGVRYLQQQSRLHFGSYCTEIKMRVKTLKGGVSGGTVASMVNLYREMAEDSAVRAEMGDLYSLCPPASEERAIQRNIGVEYDRDFNAWVGPFVMAGINTRVVLRSNALRLEPYAGHFTYDEGMLTGTGRPGEKRAKRLARNARLTTAVLAIRPLRAFVNRFFLPKPGTGPSPRAQHDGNYDLRFFGRTAEGQEIIVKVTGDRDPGYGSTAKMLAQAAISLRRDVDKGEVRGGFWTPATAFNDRLIERLQNYAGMVFEVQEVVSTPPSAPQLLPAD